MRRHLFATIVIWFFLGAVIHSSPASATDISLDLKDTVPFSALPEQVCGIELIDPEIPTHYPITQRFGEISDNNIYCTATVIGPRLLLTAAHCLAQVEAPDVQYAVVCPGGIRIPFNGPNANSQIPESKNGPGQPNDIGVIQLNQDIGIPPVRLPVSKEEVLQLFSHPETCMQVGFGFFSEGNESNRTGLVNGTYSRSLKLATVSEMERYAYGLDSINNQHLPASQFIATNIASSENQIKKMKWNITDPYLFLHGKGAAGSRGDSGGPLLCRSNDGSWVDLGTLTGGITGLTDIYINVWSHQKWINTFLHDSVPLDPAIRLSTLKMEINHACEQAGACLNTISKKHILLTSETLKIMNKIRDAENMQGKQDALDVSLEKMRILWLEFIQHCFSRLIKK